MQQLSDYPRIRLVDASKDLTSTETALLNAGYVSGLYSAVPDFSGPKNGAKRIRTAGLLNAIETRYQLRYSPLCIYHDAAN